MALSFIADFEKVMWIWLSIRGTHKSFSHHSLLHCVLCCFHLLFSLRRSRRTRTTSGGNSWKRLPPFQAENCRCPNSKWHHPARQKLIVPKRTSASSWCLCSRCICTPYMFIATGPNSITLFIELGLTDKLVFGAQQDGWPNTNLKWEKLFSLGHLHQRWVYLNHWSSHTTTRRWPSKAGMPMFGSSKQIQQPLAIFLLPRWELFALSSHHCPWTWTQIFHDNLSTTMSEEGLLLQDSSGMDLEFRGVGASLGGKQILKDVSGVVRRGEMLAIMGASGK